MRTRRVPKVTGLAALDAEETPSTEDAVDDGVQKYEVMVTPRMQPGSRIRFPVPGSIAGTAAKVTVEVPVDAQPGDVIEFTLASGWVDAQVQFRSVVRLQAQGRGFLVRHKLAGKTPPASSTLPSAAHMQPPEEPPTASRLPSYNEVMTTTSRSGQPTWPEEHSPRDVATEGYGWPSMHASPTRAGVTLPMQDLLDLRLAESRAFEHSTPTSASSTPGRKRGYSLPWRRVSREGRVSRESPMWSRESRHVS